MLVPKAREDENGKSTVSQIQNKQKHLKRKLKTLCIFGTYCMCTKCFLWEFTKNCSKFWIKYLPTQNYAETEHRHSQRMLH